MKSVTTKRIISGINHIENIHEAVMKCRETDGKWVNINWFWWNGLRNQGRKENIRGYSERQMPDNWEKKTRSYIKQSRGPYFYNM